MATLGLNIKKPARYALLSSAMAAVGVAVFWGFTVDDAQITARVAHHLATGHGYRFNTSGPIVDAVTPLGWAHVLAPFGVHGQQVAFWGARLLGVLCWISSAAWLGLHVGRREGVGWPLVLLACLAPVGMWASAGMETGVVTALVTLSLARTAFGLGCLGLAVAWRPELLAFACVWTSLSERAPKRILRNLVLAIGPSVLVAVARWFYFGSTYPLAIVAKPSDARLGFWYSLEALCWSGPIWLWLAMRWPRLGAMMVGRAAWDGLDELSATGVSKLEPARQVEALGLAAAVLAHAVATTLAGGDWMAGYRLFVPVMPAMLYVACCLSVRSRFLLGIALLLAGSTMLRVAYRLYPAAHRIVEQRQVLIGAAAKEFAQAKVVASPDVGWVGAAFPGEILDLAGATDPSVAYLRGGHTSKQIHRQLFIARQVDRIVVLLAPGTTVATPWSDSSFARNIDFRAAMLGLELGCRPITTLPLPFTSQSYLVLGCPSGSEQH